MPPKGTRSGPRDKNKYPWPYVPNPPLNPNPLVGPPSPVGRRRQARKVALPSPPSDSEEERRMTEAITEVLAAIPVEPLEDLATPAEPAAPVVVASHSSDEEQQDPVKKKFRAKKKRNPTPYVQPLFQRTRSGNTAAMA